MPGPVDLIYFLFKVTLCAATCFHGEVEEKAKGIMAFPGTGPVEGSWLNRVTF